jgi:hypothetical protein
MCGNAEFVLEIYFFFLREFLYMVCNFFSSLKGNSYLWNFFIIGKTLTFEVLKSSGIVKRGNLKRGIIK